AIVLIAPMVLVPAGAASADESNDKNNTTNQITLLVPLSEEMIRSINSNGAEIEINSKGLPVIVVKEPEGEFHIPFKLPDTMKILYDSKLVVAEVDRNYSLIPVVEDDEIEIERVCISDFYVKEITNDGQIVLKSEVNPVVIKVLWKVTAVAVGQVGFAVLGAWKYDHLKDYRQFDYVVVNTPLRGKYVSPGMRFLSAPNRVIKAEVVVSAYDLDDWERIPVGIKGLRTGEIHWLEEPLTDGGDNITAQVGAVVQRHSLGVVGRILMENDGRIAIVLEDDRAGHVVIESVGFGFTYDF
ncbi:hypothetical protein M1N12_03115, partial [Peptococcaceae bacterium]|nr:hypothetical protein [Peptococcaceae bacterium]